MRRIVPVSGWLLDTKGAPDQPRGGRRDFLRLSAGVIGAGALLPIVGLGGCGDGSDPGAQVDEDETSTQTDCPDPTTEEYLCDVEFPEGFKCDPQTAGGMKHTPVVSNFSSGDDAYGFDVVVPHVVTPGHHIMGCQVVSFVPGATNPWTWVDFHYYTNDYIMGADDAEWSHSFSVSHDSVVEQATHLQVFSICNKHGNHGATQTLS